MRISDWSSDVCSSDLLAPRGLARVGRADHAAIVIGMDRLGRPSRRERARRLLLPVVALPAYLGDLGPDVALGHAAERRTRLDSLHLIGLAHHHALCPPTARLDNHPPHLVRPAQSGT